MNTWAVPGYTESLELGSGASGRVVLAVHEQTGLPVAVKYLSESLRARPGFVRGFRAEAELLGGLQSPYVAGFYEYVEAADGAAIVMELVDGVSLRTLLSRQGPLSPESALAVLKGSLLGLADAHRAGVVHRDYKPENVLVASEGVSKLVDFGIAVDAGISAGVAGTPAYMAPEQWTGAPASPAGDVYAATATFFECLTGRKPYSGDNLAALAFQHVEEPVPVAEVPEGVRELVRRGLAKTAAGRPADAAAFVTDLERAAVAHYGGDWEERGRARLAALVALLLFLSPAGRLTPRTTTDTARTVLGRESAGGRLHTWRPTWPGAAVAAAAALLAILLSQGAGPGGGGDSGPAAQALATTSAAPLSATDPLPSTTSAPVPSATTSSTPSTTSLSPSPADPSASPSTPVAPPASPPTPGASTTSDAPTPPGSPSPTTSASPPPSPPAVKDVTVTGFRQTGAATATATITVTADGTGPITVTVDWSTADAGAGAGSADGAPVTYRRSGATQYTLTVDHTFQGNGCYWTVRAATSPASADGGASEQLLTRRCELR
ncbi:serine/threonine protein kinase [Streptomyces sp. NBC_01275]|uniref:serine/threonine-protein kinase n=1 Tax=Streptomyces sp. NBC_01275 TaxID=2903807 RepID=UPI0022592F39|nr:serine/threonine-protein kinase [Streptomyces sp. NBC_01275]MCX4767656.1 serine/threonine protein kinase [Streptomyces sp. NBC_01275]